MKALPASLAPTGAGGRSRAPATEQSASGAAGSARGRQEEDAAEACPPPADVDSAGPERRDAGGTDSEHLSSGTDSDSSGESAEDAGAGLVRRRGTGADGGGGLDGGSGKL
mmetsp:Transcript_69776/g.207942  ORF Transcript_69776/g.207942 Transcript_69776/m.207942 type:complete len:111 (-) Transcript_69776:6-338(-)